MKIKVYVQTNYVGSRDVATIDIDDSELAGMEVAEREQYIEDVAKEQMWQMIEWGWDEA